jgi:CheY-like chemotaxis protein
MASNISVKVVGFSDAERHSLNTLFRLSEGAGVAFAVWTADAVQAPDVVLIDADSAQAQQEIAATAAQPDLRVISVGAAPVAHAWRSFQRPVDWTMLLELLGAVALAQADGSQDVSLHEPAHSGFDPDPSACLLVGFSLENGLYLRARLALAGLYDVDDAESAVQAQVKLKHRRYSLVIVDLSSNDIGAWALVQSLGEWSESRRLVAVATSDRSSRTLKMIEPLGCTAVLEIPFAPQQVLKLLQHVTAVAPFA